MIRLKVDLIISGDKLDPAHISQLLNVTPDDQQLKGDHNVDPTGRQFAKRTVGLWSIGSQLVESASLNEHVQAVLSRVSGSAVQLKKFKADSFDVYLFVGAFISKGNGVFRIDSSLMRSLADVGVDIDVDIYSDD